MTLQALIHWLEQGAGARWLARAALLLGVLALAAVLVFKQFQGARTEETLRQAVVGRALAEGKGFSTPVNYPQTHALLHERGAAFDREHWFPELYHPPGYPLAVGAALAVLPEERRERLFERPVESPAGFGADYFLLGLNLLLLAVATGQTWRLGCRLFDPATGALAALGVILSVSVWSRAIAVDGTPLAMVLLLGVFQSVLAAERAGGAGWRSAGAWLVAGTLAGLLFLTDYPTGVLVPLLAGYAIWRRQLSGAVLLTAAALLVATPWVVRNVRVSGHPLALAAQDAALRSGDPTAEPTVVRASPTPERPPLSLNKLGNKTLTAIEVALRERLWSSGGLFFTGFFIAGWLYRFRREEANRLRGLVTLALVLLVLGQGAMNSGEGERHPLAMAAPLIVIFGAGFFKVLAASSSVLSRWPRLAAAGLLGLQALPLLQDVMEPRRLHFSYPPYFPSFFQGLRVEMGRRGGDHPAWMADVPAGAAWYSGQRVWAQPARLRDFQAIQAEQPVIALVLTPHTLDRSLFEEMAGARTTDTRSREWADIYHGLIHEQLPAAFPLSQVQRLAGNFYVLLDPQRVPWRGN